MSSIYRNRISKFCQRQISAKQHFGRTSGHENPPLLKGTNHPDVGPSETKWTTINNEAEGQFRQGRNGKPVICEGLHSSDLQVGALSDVMNMLGDIIMVLERLLDIKGEACTHEKEDIFFETVGGAEHHTVITIEQMKRE